MPPEIHRAEDYTDFIAFIARNSHTGANYQVRVEIEEGLTLLTGEMVDCNRRCFFDIDGVTTAMYEVSGVRYDTQSEMALDERETLLQLMQGIETRAAPKTLEARMQTGRYYIAKDLVVPLVSKNPRGDRSELKTYLRRLHQENGLGLPPHISRMQVVELERVLDQVQQQYGFDDAAMIFSVRK